MRTIGENIRKRRKELGITQQNLADMAEVSVNQLTGYETGKRTPGLWPMYEIAKALNTTIDALIEGE